MTTEVTAKSKSMREAIVPNAPHPPTTSTTSSSPPNRCPPTRDGCSSYTVILGDVCPRTIHTISESPTSRPLSRLATASYATNRTGNKNQHHTSYNEPGGAVQYLAARGHGVCTPQEERSILTFPLRLSKSTRKKGGGDNSGVPSYGLL